MNNKIPLILIALGVLAFNCLSCPSNAAPLKADAPDTLYALSKSYAESGDYDKAAATLKHFIELKEQNPEKTYFYRPWHICELADLYYHQHKWSDAIPLYEQTLTAWQDTRRWPEMIPALDKLANCLGASNRTAESEKDYTHALEICGKARKMAGLEKLNFLFDIYDAEICDDYSAMLKSSNRISQADKAQAKADTLWKQLSTTALPSPDVAAADLTISKSHITGASLKAKVLERFGSYYCRIGKYAEAEVLFDMLADTLTAVIHDHDGGTTQKTIATVRALQKQCQKYSPLSYSEVSIKNRNHPTTNSYLVEFSKLRTRQDFFTRRSQLVSQFAYAVPTKKILNEFAQYQPILEIGAGTGYWSYLLRQMGIKVTAYEPYPLSAGKNAWFPLGNKSWTTILPGDETVVKNYPQYTLFMCYPPGRTQVAYSALKNFKGKHVIYVGEAAGIAPGQGQDDFHRLLEKDWVLEKQLDMPQWLGLYDAFYVYRRK